MPDSVRIKEIHEALQADTFSTDDKDPNKRRVANLGYYIERIARILGISVNSDGSVRSIRQSRWVPQDGVIPAGWSIGQWGRNQGGSSEGQEGGKPEDDRDGLAYEVRSGRFEFDSYTGETSKIVEGGYVLVENLPQLLHLILDDFDKALGMQDAGAFVIPGADKGNYGTFEGLASFNAEILYMLSALSINIRQGHVSSLKNQAMLMEILAGLGLPVEMKQFRTDFGEKEFIPVPYPGLRQDSPSLVDFFVWVLSNLSPLVAAQLSFNPKEKDQSENQSDWSEE